MIHVYALQLFLLALSLYTGWLLGALQMGGQTAPNENGMYLCIRIHPLMKGD